MEWSAEEHEDVTLIIVKDGDKTSKHIVDGVGYKISATPRRCLLLTLQDGTKRLLIPSHIMDESIKMEADWKDRLAQRK